MQVVASDIGATVLGITESNVRQYLLELMYAVVAGQLPAAKFAVGLKASGVKMEAQSPDVLVQLLWYALLDDTCLPVSTLGSAPNHHTGIVPSLLHASSQTYGTHLHRRDISCRSLAWTACNSITALPCLQGGMDASDLQRDGHC